MANRTTVKSNIVAQNIPTVTNAILTGMLNTELADNVRFREDVAVVQNSGVSGITVDFTGKDRVDLTRTGGSLAITITGISDGETKFLLITKTAGQAVTWVGVTDVTPVKGNANALPLTLYEIVRKGSYYFAKAWVESVVQATDSVLGLLAIASSAEHNALASLLKACVPGRLPIASETQKGLIEMATDAENVSGSGGLAATPATMRSTQAWQNLTLNSGWSGQLVYFIDNLGFVHIRANQLKRSSSISVNSTESVCTLPAVAEPQFDMKWSIQSYNPANQNNGQIHTLIIGEGIALNISTSIHAYTTDWLIKFYVIFRRTI